LKSIDFTLFPFESFIVNLGTVSPSSTMIVISKI
jgi:hypothetical protein